MGTAAPTQREICILVFLLVSLLTLSKSNFDFSLSRRTAPTALDSAFTPSASRNRDGFAQALENEISQGERSILSWGKGQIPRTEIVAHAPGWTVIDRLYAVNGTLFIVTDEPEKVPDRERMISKAHRIENGAEAEAARLPSDREMRIISTQEAAALVGKDADIVDGVTWFANDPPQFIQHYYHWSAELFFGFWRTYSSLDPSIMANGSTSLPAPRRMLFAHADADHWRDYASMNQLVLRSAFPSITLEFADDWHDRIALGRPLVFDRVVLADRSAAMLGFNFHRSQRTASEPFALPGSANWWSSVRRNVIKFAGIEEVRTDAPVITYISRQGWGRRMLRPEDHDKLVEELYRLRDMYGYEVNIVSMENLSRSEQLHLAARTTIMMGVHGNGLTSLVWMKPSPRATVMEFFFPGGFAHDYEYTTRALGMVHYGFWDDKPFTSPQTPDVLYPEGFQGNAIPIDGAVVARLCHARLSLSDEADD
ncbi:hypothetical protein PLICRDRAFT_121283 [Plicaturopsis crispa FD-325 SS-3]|nr:hypothetical protein PLICRDRAFT_121283 [Plicaturopsis crispa FD-325 SS-3]